ncbi:MAG: hypothetical protein OEM38_10525 [Gammaproteobacteria bacterium]|nr:hypothetical protein [Gammaproteobacteria bacterium]
MQNYSPLIASLIVIFFLSGCAKEEVEHSLESDLTGVWQIERIHSNPITQVFTKTYYNVYISDEDESVDITHCKQNENMHFVRDESYLTNNDNNQLHIVSGAIIESVDIPNIVQLTKTSKNNFLNAGTIALSVDTNKFEPVYTNSGVCAQKIVKSTDVAGTYRFKFSFPFESSYMEIDLEYTTTDDVKINNIQSLTFTSPSLAHAYRSYSLKMLSVESESISVTDSSVKFDFEITTVIKSVFAGDKLSGSIQVQY